MRAMLALSLVGAALTCGSQIINPATAQTAKAAAPEPQKAMGPWPHPLPSKCARAIPPLGVARVVEIDTTGGPAFGFQHYKTYDFLNPKEVVLTFDDGPLPNRTPVVLAALAAECTKATFFSVGKVAAGYPEILRDVAKAGHTSVDG